MSADVLNALIVIFTAISTVTSVLLWITTLKATRLTGRSFEVLVEQVRNQIASNHSLSSRQMIQSQREITLTIMNNPKLRDTFVAANKLDPHTWEMEMVAQFMINTAYATYIDLSHGVIGQEYEEGFRRDLQNFFSYGYVRERWSQIRDFYPRHFVESVERKLIPAESELPALPENKKMPPLQ